MPRANIERQPAAPSAEEVTWPEEIELLTQEALKEGKQAQISTDGQPLPVVSTNTGNAVPREHFPEVQIRLDTLQKQYYARDVLRMYQASFPFSEDQARAHAFDVNDIIERRDSELLQVHVSLSNYMDDCERLLVALDRLNEIHGKLLEDYDNLKKEKKNFKNISESGLAAAPPTVDYSCLYHSVSKSLDKTSKELTDAEAKLAQQAIDFKSQERRYEQIRNKPTDVPALKSRIVMLEEDQKLTASLTKHTLKELETENNALRTQNRLLEKTQEESGVMEAKTAAQEANKRVAELEKQLKGRDNNIVVLKADAKTKDENLAHYAIIGKRLGQVRARTLNKSRPYDGSSKVTQIGNKAAHEGDIQVEIALYQTGHLKEKTWFDNAYSLKLASVLDPEHPETLEAINSSKRLREVYNFGATIHEAICLHQKEGMTSARHNEIMSLRKDCLKQWDHCWDDATTVAEAVRAFDADVDVHQKMTRISFIFEELRKFEVAKAQKR